MSQKKYWQSFGELNNSEAIQKAAQDEFREDLPFEGMDLIGDTKTPRRDFLKYVGFSTAAAALAASCEVPVRKVIPYVNKPQEITPGVANYYATSYQSGSEVVPVVAKVRDGRPIKIEGNDLSTLFKGGTNSRVQASVLDLYDTARLRYPTADGKELSLEAFDKAVGDALGGSAVVLLTPTVSSPSTRQIIGEFLAKYPGSRHVQYDGVSYSSLLLAAEASYGKKAIPTYHFGKAKVLVSLGADFLGPWLNSIENQKGYASLRKISEKNPEMSKHFQFESIMSLTGANADERYTHRPSQSGAVALALLAALQGQPVSGVEDKLKKGIEKAAKELLAAKGAALVVSGSQKTEEQIVVNAINEAIGANGTTVDFGASLLTRQGLDSDIAGLLADMEAGKVASLIIHDTNPVYDYFDGARFAAALKKVKTTVSLNGKNDETTELCKYVLPANHYLESWGDAEVKPGYFCFAQPTINPLFKTRQLQDNLLKWSGSSVPYHEYFETFWKGKLGGEEAYIKALKEGVVEPAAYGAAAAAYSTAKLEEAKSALANAKKGGKYELVIYQQSGLGDGRHSNNPWLLETPDPITKATWDNYVMMSPVLAKELLGVDLISKNNQVKADAYEMHAEKPVVKVTVGKAAPVELPVLIVPGMETNTIGIAVGYGRSAKLGMALTHSDGNSVGKNAYPLALDGNWQQVDVALEKSVGTYKIAQNQTHSSYEGRTEVVKELTLDQYKKNPRGILDDRNKELAPWGGLENFDKQGTIYPYYDKPGIKWGMSIDMNSCFGCGACVVACTAENNVAVVGKSEVLRFHDMQWMRIDRYFSGNPEDADSIQTVFMPMLCQHCDNAPCENVCPVAATNHSTEGLNQMTYNRCIGTRYCANNCPYKVRRFNWADYTGADSFPDNQHHGIVGALDESVLMMNDDLTRMVLNPDVTVRSRGVIEKCSFCVQRLQEGKLKAKKENRTLVDSDIKTACQQSCPADAIVFGNVNNKDSEISTVRRENPNRLFYALEQLHVLPNVNYLAKVRNAEVAIGAPKEEGEEKEVKAAEKA